MMRRLIVALRESKVSAERWAKVNAVLAAAIVFLTFVLIFR